MIWTQILISLRNADPTALTALSCLRRSMRMEGSVTRLQRRILWELSGPEGADPEVVIGGLRLGGELWNPNKEQARIRLHPEAVGRLHLAAEGEGNWVHALAWSPERDLDRRPHALRVGQAAGWSLRRGTLWSLEVAGGDPEERRKLAGEAVLCSSVGKGLLVHPHLEDLRWIEGDPPRPWIGQRGTEGRSA